MPVRSTLLFILFSCYLLVSNVANAIVPVDQSNVAEEGFSGNVGISLNGQSGNKEEREYSLSSIIRYGHLANSFIFITDYNYSETNDLKDEDDFYSHLRWIRNDFFRPNVDSELFIQYEYDDIADLSSRKLAGGGVRWRYNRQSESSEINTLLGLGAFYEVEESLSNNAEVSTTRANFYAKFLYGRRTQFPFDAYLTLYYQPAVDDIKNFRAIVISGIEFKITQTLSLNVEAEVDHDSSPFTNVEETDIEYGVRMTYSF
ncbi:DUF481 domain-containing protein [Alteromonas pelagimontana]|uniref:DUF481 domain-containing protein n=1 Tax=Alteromonas pelagimontana TaxID=1858656 RepID=A0A6M4MFS7_9ALTE|nr:DUF481 domain-containing protein [Alteromonas pelagimontana]QJR81922.1 DUF481 domain-containing protein [Alteromonas pelagimontana]